MNLSFKNDFNQNLFHIIIGSQGLASAKCGSWFQPKSDHFKLFSTNADQCRPYLTNADQFPPDRFSLASGAISAKVRRLTTKSDHFQPEGFSWNSAKANSEEEGGKGHDVPFMKIFMSAVFVLQKV